MKNCDMNYFWQQGKQLKNKCNMSAVITLGEAQISKII